MTNRPLFVDAMNLVHRCAHVPAFTGMTDTNGRSTGIIHGFLTSLLRFARSTDSIIVCWDSRSERKRAISPEYKAKRDEKDPIKKLLDEEIKKQIKPLQRILHLMGFIQYKINGYEADEIIGALALHSLAPCVIMSEDKDFLQLVSPQISIWQPIRKRMITCRNFGEHYYDITPEQYFHLRNLCGDVSDEISGVPGCGIETGLEIVRNARLKEPLSGKLTKRLLKKTDMSIIKTIATRNRQLMELSEESIPLSALGFNKRSKIYNRDFDRLEGWLKSYNLNEVKQLFIERRLP